MMNEKLATQTTEMPETKTDTTETMWNGAFCDECGAMAVFKAKQVNYELNFCGHHVRKNAEALLKAGFTIEPENYFL